jgi:hypothetical protein
VTKGMPHVRDVWNRLDVNTSEAVDKDVLYFEGVKAHDSIFLVITPATGAL